MLMLKSSLTDMLKRNCGGNYLFRIQKELIHIVLMISLSLILATGRPDPPTDIQIHVIGNTAKVSWIIPTNQGITWSRISLSDSKEGDFQLSLGRRFKDQPYPASNFELANLKMCSEYNVRIQFIGRLGKSAFTTQKFWMTNNTVTANINENVAVAWTTDIQDFFDVSSPSLKNIYVVQGGIYINFQSTKYKYDKSTTDFQKINITIINVNETDAGLYTTNNYNTHVDGCCLLVVTAKPLKPTLALNAEHPFVGDNITFTCHSMVQRWPSAYRTSHLSYQFNENKRGVAVNNMLTIHKLAKWDKGKDISCQATDDLHKVSIKSDAVTLDPYYGPDNIVLKPGHTTLNVSEGTMLGPIKCAATCYPKCLFEWTQNRTGTFDDVLSGETLVVANIEKNQAGIYRCLAVHPSNGTLLRRTDISVNVQYSSKIVALWLSDKNVTYGSGSSTIFSFSEGNHLTITLRIDSNPDPQIIVHSSLLNFPTLIYTKQSKDFSVKLPSLKCENSGQFTILASNGIAYGDNKTVQLLIRCKPRDVKTERKIVAKVNNDVNIVMDVVSFPAPTVIWIRMTTFVWTVQKGKYDYRHYISSTIRITSEDGFGDHGIKICNTLGCIVEYITLKPEDMPEAPQYFSVGLLTDKSVILSWIAGFNGGHQQTFSVQFKTTDDDKWDEHTVHNDGTRTGSTVYYKLDQLKPDSRYQVMVLSGNIHGQRNTSLEFKTKVEYTGKSTSKTTSISTLSIVLACGYPVLFAVIIILLVFINRRNKGSTEGSNPMNINSTTSDEYTVIQRNNPTFTEPYSTLQSPTESTALQADSMETDTYDECGIITNVEVNQNMENRKSGDSKDEHKSDKEHKKDRMYDNLKI